VIRLAFKLLDQQKFSLWDAFRGWFWRSWRCRRIVWFCRTGCNVRSALCVAVGSALVQETVKDSFVEIPCREEFRHETRSLYARNGSYTTKTELFPMVPFTRWLSGEQDIVGRSHNSAQLVVRSLYRCGTRTGVRMTEYGVLAGFPACGPIHTNLPHSTMSCVMLASHLPLVCCCRVSVPSLIPVFKRHVIPAVTAASWSEPMRSVWIINVRNCNVES
jgi:hypothetical protein